MKQFTLLLMVLVAAVVPGANVCLAQIGYTPSSIEWLTTDCDVVVRASVANLAVKDRAPAPGEIRSEKQWVTVTLKVDAILKGKAPETIVFVLDMPRGQDTLTRWKESSQAVLWFLIDIGDAKEELPRDFPAQAQGKLRLREHYSKFVGVSAIELGSPKKGKRVRYPVFSMDFQVLEEEDKILDAVRAHVAKPGKPTGDRIGIAMPREVANRSGRAGDANVLYVPVNDRLETLGRVWVRSNEDWLRRAGVLALSQFKSETNVGILKGMLADGAWWRETKSDDGGQMKQERVYYIREAAYKTLQEWKVAIPMPVLREPLKEKQSVYFEHHIRR